MTDENQKYDSSAIDVLEGLEHVKLRPAIEIIDKMPIIQGWVRNIRYRK